MIYCANCFYCKERVKSGVKKHCYDGEYKPYFYRVVYCSKGVEDYPWHKKKEHRYGTLQLLKRKECEFYEPSAEKEWGGKIIYKMSTKSNSANGLEYYYEKVKGIKNITYDHTIKRPLGEGTMLWNKGRNYKEAYRPPPFSTNRLITDYEYRNNLDSLLAYRKLIKGNLRTMATVRIDRVSGEKREFYGIAEDKEWVS